VKCTYRREVAKNSCWPALSSSNPALIFPTAQLSSMLRPANLHPFQLCLALQVIDILKATL
jgi:hypothetical protein